MNSSCNSDMCLEIYLQKHLDEAIEKGWIKVYYQPVVRALTNKVAGYEALARWDDPIHGLLNAGVFVPVLEKYNKIYMLDLEILEQICRSYNTHVRNLIGNVPISFNLSRLDLDIENIHERINAILDKHGVPHSMIHIEITESTSYCDVTSLESHICQFHSDGYEVWMDDFGSGYSTYNTLHSQSFDTIKLDMMFIHNLNEKGTEIIRSIIKLAKKLNIRTVSLSFLPCITLHRLEKKQQLSSQYLISILTLITRKAVC